MILCRSLAFATVLLINGSALEAQVAQRIASTTTPDGAAGRVRTYFVAADELDWTYVPSGGDQALTGKRNDFSKEPGARGELDPNATTYRKARFREYTDSTFRTLKRATSGRSIWGSSVLYSAPRSATRFVS